MTELDTVGNRDNFNFRGDSFVSASLREVEILPLRIKGHNKKVIE